METKIVVDMYGKEVEVDYSNKKLYSFSNEKKELIYNVEIVENGKLTGYYTNFKEKGICENIEEKIRTFGNKLALIYTDSIGFNKDKNDKDEKIWKKFIKMVEENEEKFFKKNGDFKKNFKITEKEILNLLKD